jgi:outer membrane protein assembly factor BamB
MPLFSEHDHPNTLAAADGDGHHLWVLLHNLGEVRVSFTCGQPNLALASSGWPLAHLACLCMQPYGWVPGHGNSVNKSTHSSQSDLVKVFVGPDQPAHEVSRITGVGLKAHGLVAWGRELLLLDSDSGALVTLNPDTGDMLDVWVVPEENKFLKGLAVLDDIAYFGVTTWAERSVRDSRDNHGELAAFDLVANRLLWRRTVRVDEAPVKCVLAC